MPRTKEPYKFQDYSWSDLPNTGIRREYWGPGWMKQHDLAVEAHQVTGLKFEWWRDMISACYGGLPITLTYRDTKRVCIIEQILGTSLNSSIYIRCWGFEYPIRWKELQNVEVPQTVYLKGV